MRERERELGLSQLELGTWICNDFLQRPLIVDMAFPTLKLFRSIFDATGGVSAVPKIHKPTSMSSSHSNISNHITSRRAEPMTNKIDQPWPLLAAMAAMAMSSHIPAVDHWDQALQGIQHTKAFIHRQHGDDVVIDMPHEVLAQATQVLGCAVTGAPQFLGLP